MQSASNAYSYTWYVINGSNSEILEGPSVNITWGANPPYNINLTQTNVTGITCESGDISISPQAISAVTVTGGNPVCHESVGVYLATNYNNQNYTWQIFPSDAGSIIDGDGTNQVNIQWHTPGTHQLQVNVCGQTDMMNVIVHPRPNPIVNPSDVCPGQTVLVQPTAPFTAYEWRNESGGFISSAPSVNLGSGYYELIVTDANGCTENTVFYIDELASPEVTISTPDFGNFCEFGGTMTLYALETTGGLDYQWYFNNSPTGGNSSDLTISQEGTYYVVVTDANGCTGVSNTLGLNCGIFGPPQPCTPDGSADFSISPGIYCNVSQYLNQSVNELPNSWGWTFIDMGSGVTTNSSLENPEHTWNTAGFNLVLFEATVPSDPPGQFCLVTAHSFDTIPLAADFAILPACTDQPTIFTDLTTFVPQTSIAGWAWDFGDPTSGADNTSVLQNPQHIYTSGGIYTVTLVATDQSGCISERQLTVEIPDDPISTINIPTTSCQGATYNLSVTGSFTDVNWDFGDPGSGAANTSSIANTYHVYQSPGTYTVSLTASNIYGCSETVTQQVVVEANSITGTIDIIPANTICEGDNAILTAPIADTYRWSTNEQSQTITVTTAGVYEVTVYDAEGCAYRPPAVTIDVFPLPDGQISAVQYNEFDQPTEFFYNNYETCYGEDVFLTVTENTNYTYTWSTTETTTDISFTEEKENLLTVGTHDFTVEIYDLTTGCVNTIGPFTVTVHPVPEDVLLTSSPPTPICENTPTVISVVNPVATYTYLWNTGEVGTSINTTYAGEYFVQAVNEFGCSGRSNSIEINAGPNVNLIPEGCHTRCNPDTICVPFVPGAASYQWYLDGVAIPAPEGTIPDLIATQSGEYYLEMTDYSGCVTVSDPLTLDLFTGFGSIIGEVYFDVNNNGIIDGADTLMSNIPVILQNGGTDLDTLISNLNGSIAFANILSTAYDLVVDTANLDSYLEAIIFAANSELVGCDDLENVEFLLQLNCPTLTGTEQLQVCTGETVFYEGVELGGGEVMDFTLPTDSGCDSVVTVTVTETDVATSLLPLSACSGESIIYDGEVIPAGSQMDFTYTSSGGCDSILTVTVAELLPSTGGLTLTACTGETVDYNGTALFPNSQTDFTLVNAVGCDSILTVTVNELLATTGNLTLEACTGETVDYNGTTLTPNTQTDFTLTNSLGRDSILTVTVNELLATTESLTLSACTGETVLYEGISLAPNSQTDFFYTNAAGCDSTLTVSVQELFATGENVSLQACTGETANYEGSDLPAGSTTSFMYTNAAGCDSVVVVTVNELLATTGSLELQACSGETVDYEGESLIAGSSTDFFYTNAAGCDSVLTVTVEPLNLGSGEVELSACTGETAEYNGEQLAPGSVTTFTFPNINGCDSMVTVTVIELETNVSSLFLYACEGGTVSYNGDDLPAGLATSYSFDNQWGCDSTVSVFVLTNEITETFQELFACTGETVNYNSEELAIGDQEIFILTDQNGCDSLVEVQVSAFPEFNYELVSDAGCWNAPEGSIQVDNLTGGTAPFVYSLDGLNFQTTAFFDSLSGTSYTVSVMDDNGCVVSEETELEVIEPLEIVLYDNVIPCDYSPVRIEVEVLNPGDQLISYEWEYDGGNLPYIDVDTPGIYNVAIQNDCELQVRQFEIGMAVDEREDFFFIPNVFSPNEDLVNDEFQVFPAENILVQEFELLIFDRWGNHLYKLETVQDSWDGIFRGKSMDEGVYVWFYRARIFACGQEMELFEKGDVTIIR